VEDAALVAGVDAGGERCDQLGGALRLATVGVGLLRQRAALEEAHGEEMAAVVLAHLVDGDDVRVVERGRRLRLVAEAMDGGLVGEPGAQDHLERHGAAEARVARLVDDAHAAAAELLEDLVVGEARRVGGGGEGGKLVGGGRAVLQRAAQEAARAQARGRVGGERFAAARAARGGGDHGGYPSAAKRSRISPSTSSGVATVSAICARRRSR
jgi:hypothetical protein